MVRDGFWVFVVVINVSSVYVRFRCNVHCGRYISRGTYREEGSIGKKSRTRKLEVDVSSGRGEVLVRKSKLYI